MSRDRGHGFLGRCWLAGCIDKMQIGDNRLFDIELLIGDL
jgi:hypothetical protein